MSTTTSRSSSNVAVRKKPKIKYSTGVACCRVHNGRPEILMVRKRYTYAYNTFVHGMYDAANADALRELFNRMTTDEKHDILSLNFNQMWYRVWLHMPPNNNYYQSRGRFESAWLRDQGARLRRLIAGSSNGNCVWEIPKGRKKNPKEPDIICACREFQEETGMKKKYYKVYPETKCRFSFADDGTNYVNNYYIAITRMQGDMRVNFGIQDQIDEVGDIRWMGIEDVRGIDTHRRLESFVRRIFKYVKKQYRK